MQDKEMSDFECELGGLMNDFQALELWLRVFLHNNRTLGTSKADINLIEKAAVGDEIPLNAFTDYDPLGSLIDRVNKHPKAIASKLQIDRSLVQLRDALAHGRKYALQPRLPFKLVKFGRPKNSLVRIEFTAAVSTEWLVDQRKRLRQALEGLGAALGAVDE
jgi:hypothetical protein